MELIGSPKFVLQMGRKKGGAQWNMGKQPVYTGLAELWKEQENISVLLET